ncbi:hypothetical protein PAMA_011231 [Pampus argenteus]
MKTASRSQQRSSPPLVQMRRYTPGVYPFLFPSVISSLPQLPPPSPQRLQIQQPSSSGSTPSPVEQNVSLLDLEEECGVDLLIGLVLGPHLPGEVFRPFRLATLEASDRCLLPDRIPLLPQSHSKNPVSFAL